MLLRLDQGFAHPHVLRYKNSKGEVEEVEEEEDSDEESKSEESDDDEEDEEEAREEEEQEGLDPNVRVI